MSRAPTPPTGTPAPDTAASAPHGAVPVRPRAPGVRFIDVHRALACLDPPAPASPSAKTAHRPAPPPPAG